MIGSSLSHYEITAKLGEGGMGVVYRATDGKLGREVAIKVLPPELAGDSERLARFEREAKILANLNHPNIAQIYGFDEAGDVHFLVMELAGGRTLAERLQRGPVAVDQAVQIGVRICVALEAAHNRGIVHRDLKPANVHVDTEASSDPEVKVLDFGLAKPVPSSVDEADGDLSSTLTQVTTTGVLLGTAAYMSPEQTRGRQADARSDIWAFGCLLFELLTGERAFQGENLSDVLAAILKDEPRWELLPESTPQAVRRSIRRCLAKEPRNRYQHVGDLRLDLEESELVVASSSSVPIKVVSLLLVGFAGGLITGWGLSALVNRSTQGASSSVLRATLDAPTPGTIMAVNSNSVSISPDGRRLAAAGSDDSGARIWVKEIHEENWRALPGTEAGYRPRISPDGRWVLFDRGASLSGPLSDQNLVTPFDGGPVSRFPEMSGVSWSPGSALLGWKDTEVVRTTLAGEERTHLECGPDIAACLELRNQPILPVSSDAVLLSRRVWDKGSRYGSRDSVFYWRTGEEPVQVLENARQPSLVQDVLLFVRDEEIWASRLAPDGRPIGEAIAVRERPFSVHPKSSFHFEVAGSAGTLFFLESLSDFDLWEVDRSGLPRSRLGGSISSGLPAFGSPQMALLKVSPDGQNAIVSTTGELRVVSLSDRYASRPLPYSDAGWASDSSIVASNRPDQYLEVLRTDGRSMGRISLRGSGRIVAGDVDAVRGRVLFHRIAIQDGEMVGPRTALYTVEMESSEPEVLWYDSAGWDRYPALSPDGNWVAFESDEGGRIEVNVSPWQDRAEPFPVSADGGQLPRWSKDGKTLYFVDVDNSHLMAVDATPNGPRSFSAPREVFRIPPRTIVTQRAAYDTLVDGNFLFALARDEQRHRIVQNWFARVDEALDEANGD